MNWNSLVSALITAKDTLFDSALLLFHYFITPFGILIDEAAQDSWIVELLESILNLFSLDLMSMTPLQFMLGSTIPLIIIFTVYRYIKQ